MLIAEAETGQGAILEAGEGQGKGQRSGLAEVQRKEYSSPLARVKRAVTSAFTKG